MAYVGFKKLKKKIAEKGNVKDPGAVAAAIGRAKYGSRKMADAAKKGKSLKGAKSKAKPKKK